MLFETVCLKVEKGRHSFLALITLWSKALLASLQLQAERAYKFPLEVRHIHVSPR